MTTSDNIVRTVLVTGSDRGIGKAIALAFARRGARVALHGLATENEANVLVEEMKEAGCADARFFPGDLRDSAIVETLMESVSSWQPVNVLVNNAGIQRTGPFAEISNQDWADVLAVNLSAPFQTMRHVLPAMARSGFGRVVNIASVHGLVASPEKALYVAAKFGLVGLSRVAALEYAAAGDARSGGVTVNCICPGWVDTAILAPQIEERGRQLGLGHDAALVDMVSDKQPSRRLSGPDEIARLAIWLCAPESHNVTGTAIPIDGGWTAQ